MYKLLVCTRYLRTRYIALASIISLMLGMATIIAVNGAMADFSSEMGERIYGFLADMELDTARTDSDSDCEWQMKKIQEVAGPYIEATTHPTAQTADE